MCWEWEDYIYRNWLKEQKKQEKKQELAEEKEVEEISEVKEKRIRSDAPIYKYVKSEKISEGEKRKKVAKMR